MDHSMQNGTGSRPLKGSELLVLQILASQSGEGDEEQPMIVGDIQRAMEVLPAQMSRLLRSLEARDPPLVECRINPRDKRQVNVYLAPAGKRSLRSANAGIRRQAVALQMSLRYPPKSLDVDAVKALRELLVEIQLQCPELQFRFAAAAE